MSTYAVQVLSGISDAAVLFILASGLTLIFGALDIINFAHGSFYMVGGFLAFSLSQALGFGDVSFWLVLVVASVGVGVLGVLVEMVVIRRIYGRHILLQILVTFAFVLVISGAIRAIYGADPRLLSRPPFLDGAVAIMGRNFPVYQIFLMVLAVAVGLALWLIMEKTALGRLVKAAVSDRELLSLSGVNVRWLFTAVFGLGCLFAGLAGAAVSPQGAVQMGIDVEVVVKAFVIVVIGGLGSLKGAALAALIVGVSEALGTLWLPEASLGIVFAVAVAVLIVRPAGMFGTAQA